MSPTSGTQVKPGTVLIYKLSFANSTGTAPAPVNYTDNLSNVLDDATVVTAPSASTPSITVGAITTTHGTFKVTGTVPAGKTVTVTYSVRVDSPATGDHVLTNFLFPTTTPTPGCKTTATIHCTTNPVPAISIKKTATPTTVHATGTKVTYKFVVTNTGATALHNVTVTDKFISPSTDDVLVDSDQVRPGDNDRLLHLDNHCQPAHRQEGHLHGDLQGRPGGPDKRRDQQLGGRQGQLDDTAHTFEDNAGGLHTVEGLGQHVEPGHGQDREPDLGTQVKPGTVLIYKLSFANSTGTAPAPVNYTDNLSNVLDDATVVTAPSASTPSITVGAITTTHGTFKVTGTVPAGKTVTVTYSVRVDSPATGDHVLTNFLFPTTTPTPGCKTTATIHCTTNPVPAISIKKTATPTTVHATGTKVTYKFVVTNTGATALHNVTVTDKFISPSTADFLITTIKCVPATTTGSCTSTTTASLPIGKKATFTVIYKVVQGDLTNGVINNSAVAKGNSTTPHTPSKTTPVVSTPSKASVNTSNLVTAKTVSPTWGPRSSPAQCSSTS